MLSNAVDVDLIASAGITNFYFSRKKFLIMHLFVSIYILVPNIDYCFKIKIFYIYK